MSLTIAEKVKKLKSIKGKKRVVLEAVLTDPGITMMTIAKNHAWGYSTVTGYLTDIYEKLGVPADITDSAKRQWIFEQYSEIYKEPSQMMEEVFPPTDEPEDKDLEVQTSGVEEFKDESPEGEASVETLPKVEIRGEEIEEEEKPDTTPSDTRRVVAREILEEYFESGEDKTFIWTKEEAEEYYGPLEDYVYNASEEEDDDEWEEPSEGEIDEALREFVDLQESMTEESKDDEEDFGDRPGQYRISHPGREDRIYDGAPREARRVERIPLEDPFPLEEPKIEPKAEPKIEPNKRMDYGFGVPPAVAPKRAEPKRSKPVDNTPRIFINPPSASTTRVDTSTPKISIPSAEPSPDVDNTPRMFVDPPPIRLNPVRTGITAIFGGSCLYVIIITVALTLCALIYGSFNGF